MLLQYGKYALAASVMLFGGPMAARYNGDALYSGRKSSAAKADAKPRRRALGSVLQQGAKEHERVHAAAGFQPIKITPRPAEAFAYMPDFQSRQVIRAHQRGIEKARAHQAMLTERADRRAALKERKAARRKAA